MRCSSLSPRRAPPSPGVKPAPAAAKGEGTNPDEAKPDASKDEGSEAKKPEEGAPTVETGSPEAQPEGCSIPVSLGELTKDEFVIRTSNFIPADAVTRQSGKVSSDAPGCDTTEVDLDRGLLLYAEGLCG